MPYQDSYPVLAGLPASAYVTGFWTDASGKLQTVKIPASFVYGTKWTTGSGVPTVAGFNTGDLYLDITSGDIYTWSAPGNTWGSPITNLINGELTLSIWASAPPAASQVLQSLNCPWPAQFPANFAGSYASANVAATASAVFSVTQNGTQVGTITFAANATTGTFATVGGAAPAFSAGDILNIVAPNPQDATLAGIRISLVGASAGTSIGASAILEYSLLKSNNLSDLQSVSTARTNLGLGSAALLAATQVALTANNLSDLASAATARTNLGLGTAATQADSSYLHVGNNLSDVASAPQARANIGLGTAAIQNTGTSGANVPLLNGANTWAAAQTFSGGVTGTTAAWSGLASAVGFTNTGTLTGFPGRLLKTSLISTLGATTWTPQTGTTQIIVEVQGGGGGGGGSAATSTAQSSMGYGGAGGTYYMAYMPWTSGNVTVTVGAGGTAGAVAGAGGAGGTSSFGTYISCPGGSAGGNGAAAGSITANAGPAHTTSATISLPSGGVGLKSIPGMGAGMIVYGGGGTAAGATGGNAALGTGGSCNAGLAAGGAGSGFGGGGAGGSTYSASSAGQVGGAGSQGCVIIYEFA